MLLQAVDRYYLPVYNVPMSKKDVPIVSLLKELMRRRKVLPSHLAVAIGVSHASVSRWLSGRDIPSPSLCRKLAEYAGIPCDRVLTAANHMPPKNEVASADLPEFREYARLRYRHELDEDLITMIEDLIERRRLRRCHKSRNK